MGLWEVLTAGHARAEEARALLTCTSAAEFLHGVLEVDQEGAGWVRPQRMLAAQRMALCSCLAWHPGLFRQMAAATAGVCLRFFTDAREVALAVRMDAEPRGTVNVLEEIDYGGPRLAHDGIAAVVDGSPVGCAWPRELVRPLPWIEQSEGMGLVVFSLEAGTASAGIMTIPGLGARHEVCLWLPCLRGCTVRELWGDGTYMEPVAARPHLLVLGDSIAQGFCADDPGASWPALLSEQRGYDLLNQSIGGQVFQPTSLPAASLGVGGSPEDRVVVALGTNYRWDACSASVMERDARAYLREVARRWDAEAVRVVTPLWHDEARLPAQPGSCWEAVAGTLVRVAKELDLRVVDGARLLERRAALLADGEHPTARGHAHIASRMASYL